MHEIEIRAITPVTHDVRSYKTSKPEGFDFKPGQACELALMKDGYKDKTRPFTFTSLPHEDHLEFTIKHYDDHDGVTKQLAQTIVGDGFRIGDPWGTIEYKGPGVFIAGGAGITPFIAILRDLDRTGKLPGNTLIFGNKTEADIILRDELENTMPGLKVVHVLSDDNHKNGFEQGHINTDILQRHVSDFDQNFYVCGPQAMQESVMDDLKALGVKPEALTFEQ